MAFNYPGPYEVELLYSVNLSPGGAITHRQRLNCQVVADPAVGDPPSSISLVRRNTTNVLLNTAVADWTTLVRAAYNSAEASMVGYNFWKYTPGTFERTFITGEGLALAGTSATGSSNSRSDIITFKTQEGGQMRLVFLESVGTMLGIDNTPFANAQMEAIRAFVVGTTNWILARDTSYPVIAFNHLGGQNEKVFKMRYR